MEDRQLIDEEKSHIGFNKALLEEQYLCLEAARPFGTPRPNQNNRERSGRVLDSRPKGSGFEPHRRHCVVVLEQDTFILA